MAVLKEDIQEEGVVYHVSKAKTSDRITIVRTDDGGDPFVPGWFYDAAVEIPGLY